MPRTRARAPSPLPAGLPASLREELRVAIDFAEQEAEAGLLNSAARRLEAHAAALGPRLAELADVRNPHGHARHATTTARPRLPMKAPQP